MAIPIRVRKPVPVLGLDTSQFADSIEEGKSPSLLNVRFALGEVIPAPGRQIVAGPATAEAVCCIGRFSLVDGTRWAWMLTETQMFRFGNSTPTQPREWHAVPGPSITGTRRFGYASGEGFLFFSRKETGTGIYKWPGGLGAQALLVPTSGTAPPAKFLEYYNDRIIAANIIDSGEDRTNRIRWSINANHLDWGGTGSGFLDVYEGEEEPITGFKLLNDRVVIYREHSIMDFIKTGTLTPVHITQMRVNGIGCGFPYTLASSGQRHFFMGNDRNIWSWDGSQAVNISRPIERELKSLIDMTKVDDYFGVVAHDRNEYWFVMDTGDAFIFDYKTETWWRDSFPNITALGEVIDVASAGVTWDTVPGIWSDYNATTWADFGGTTTTFPALFAGREDGATFTVDEGVGYDYFAIGSIMEHFIETPDYYFASKYIGEGDPMATGVVLRMMLLYRFTGNVNPFEVSISFDNGITWATQLITPVQAGYNYVDFNATGPVCRFRFREADNATSFRWRSFTFEYEPTGDLIPPGFVAIALP